MSKKLQNKIKFTILLIVIFLFIIYKTNTLASQGQIVKITSRSSLINVGSNDSFAITQDGILGGSLVLDYLEKNNPESAKRAIELYTRLIPVENYGGEYSALQWFSEYFLASNEEKKEFLSDRFVASFYEFFAEDNYARLKEYLKRKYELASFPDENTEEGKNRLAFLEDFILFNNPRREDWEKTSKIINFLDIKPGQKIADLGSGPGYYTFRFSQLVGDKGVVFAIDTVQNHLNYLDATAKKFNIENVKTINTTGETIGIDANQVDMVFMCSLYHNIYGMSKELEIANLVQSIHKALKKDGKLIVVDNALVDKRVIPYHGPYIAKELIIGQLSYYGFELVKEDYFTPQRYTLVFKKT